MASWIIYKLTILQPCRVLLPCLVPEVRAVLYPNGEQDVYRRQYREYLERVQEPGEPTMCYALDKIRLHGILQDGHRPHVPNAIEDLYEGLLPDIYEKVAIMPRVNTLVQAQEICLQASRSQRQRGTSAIVHSTTTRDRDDLSESSLHWYGSAPSSR